MEKEIRLTPEAVRKIEEILTTGKTVEIAERHEKVIVWAVSSKKKYEQPLRATDTEKVLVALLFFLPMPSEFSDSP